MALYPWRLQADVAKGETDPMVTLFIGPERQKLDANGDQIGEIYIEQVVNEPLTMKLSELSAVLTGAPVTRPAKA